MPHDLPVYVAVGSRDPVNGGLTLLWALVDRYRAAGLSDVTVRVYDDGRHEILNEINRAEVIDDLLQWLHRVSAPPCSEDERMTDTGTDLPAPKDLDASTALIVGGTAGIGLASARGAGSGRRTPDRGGRSQRRTR